MDIMDKIKTTLGYDGCFVVDAIGHSGGLAMLWKSLDTDKLLSYSQNHIDMEIAIEGHPCF